MDLKGIAVTNPAGGQNVNVTASKTFGGDTTSVTAGAFAGGSSTGSPATAGLFASANANGHGLSVSKTVVPGIASTTAQAANVNLFQTGQHGLDAQAFSSSTKFESGFGFKQHGAGMNYSNARGHASSVGVSNIPGFGRALDVGARANILQTPNTSFDVMANSRTHLSGPLQGKSNFGVSAGITKRF